MNISTDLLTEAQLEAEVARLKAKLREKKATPLDADRLMEAERALSRIRLARSGGISWGKQP